VSEITKKIVLVVLFLSMFVKDENVYSFVPTNFFRPDNWFVRGPYSTNTKVKIDTTMEYASSKSGRDLYGKSRNILGIHNVEQNIVSALLSPVGSLSSKIQQSHGVSDIRPLFGEPSQENGALNFYGDFKQTAVSIAGGFRVPLKKISGDLCPSFCIPATTKKVERISSNVTEQVLSTSSAKAIDLLGNIKSSVLEMGNLDLSDWKGAGFGDLCLILDWIVHLKQKSKYLQNIMLCTKFGVSIPTSKLKDEDKAFSLPIGNDGAWGFPLGFGCELEFPHQIKCGILAEFLPLLNKSKQRRLKTHRHQDDILLLNKGGAVKSHGITWDCTVFGQLNNFCRRFFVKAAYAISMHHSDRLIPKGDDFDSDVINTANSLRPWYIHNLVFQLGYSFYKEFETAPLLPNISLFYKIPIVAKGAIDSANFGGQLSIGF
jgi:hypothetical protein